MSLQSVYQRFLADPKSPSLLAPDASLIYIPTTTKLEGPDAVLSHLSKQQKDLKTKAQDVLGAVEGADALCLDVETTLEFVASGGAYLPSLDNNFLTDRVATFPTVHIVRFNGQKQIQNVRIYWDQASLLRQVEVIGSRGRSWPIREANDQTRLIKSAIASKPADTGTAPPPSNTEGTEKSAASSRPVTPGKKPIRDPYAAESLTDLLSPAGDDRSEPVRAPRSAASAKPPPRDYEDLFVGDDGEEPDATPSKPRGSVAPKAGAGRNFQRNRLFDDDEQVAAEEGSQQIAYRSHPNRFSHFDIGGDNTDREIQDKPAAGRTKSRHVPQWGFDDFVTPEKPRRGFRPQEISHIPWTDEGDGPTPIPRQRVVHPRRDAETHFDLTDTDEQPQGDRTISSFQNRGHSLYHDPLADGDEPEIPPTQENLRPQSLAQNGMHRKNFGSHWDMTDSTPQENKRPHSLASNRMYHKNFDSHWDMTDSTPQETRHTHSLASNKNHHKNFDSHWDMTDSTPQENQRPQSLASNTMYRKNFESHWDMANSSPQENRRPQSLAANTMHRKNFESHWDMVDSPENKRPAAAPRGGVRKNAYERNWDFGDE